MGSAPPMPCAVIIVPCANACLRRRRRTWLWCPKSSTTCAIIPLPAY